MARATSPPAAGYRHSQFELEGAQMTLIARALRPGLESAAVDAELSCGAAMTVRLQTKSATFGQVSVHTPVTANAL